MSPTRIFLLLACLALAACHSHSTPPPQAQPQQAPQWLPPAPGTQDTNSAPPPSSRDADTPPPTPQPTPTPEQFQMQMQPLTLSSQSLNLQTQPPPSQVPLPADQAADVAATTTSGTLWKTDLPETSADVAQEGHCPLPWPMDVKNIQYVNYHSADGHTVQLTRFEAPPDFCRRYAVRWLAIHATGDIGATVSAGAFDPALAATLARQAAGDIAAPARVTWFDTDKIAHGEIYGAPAPGNPLFLIDTDRGILYFWLTN